MASDGTRNQICAGDDYLQVSRPRRQFCFCVSVLDQWYSTYFVRVPPDVISLQLCTPKIIFV
jgi:hypothetical protein